MKPKIALALSFLASYSVGSTIVTLILAQLVAINNFVFAHEEGVGVFYFLYLTLVIPISLLIGIVFALLQKK